MRRLLVPALLVGLCGGHVRAEPDGPCATRPDLALILQEFHDANASGAAAARAARLQGGGLGDRIRDDLLVVEDAGDLVVGGVTDTLEILDRALALAGDRFDFLTILAASSFPGDVEPETGFAFFHRVNNDVAGVGLPPLQDPGLATLRGVVNLNDLDEYPGGPSAVLPGFNGVISGVELLGHETGHWVEAYVAATAAQIQGRDGSHWSFYMNTGGSVMEGNLWVDNGDGSFTTAPASEQYAEYSRLDLYLWGLMSAEEVTEPIFVIADPTANPGQGRFSPPQGGFTTGGARVDVTMEDIVSSNGPRQPPFDPGAPSPRRFTMGLVLVVPFGEEPSAADLSLMAQFRAQFEAWFAAHTQGRATIDTRIPDVPVTGDFSAVPRAGGPAPFTVEFAGTPAGSVSGVSWDFGDGAASTEVNPEHTYETNGFFTVTLRIDGAGGPVVIRKPAYVAVGSFDVVLADDFEIDGGWSVDPADTATAGRWERADPQGTFVGTVPAQPEEDHTPQPGTRCWVTGAAAGAAAGANDVDAGQTALLSPLFSLAGRENAWLGYFLWYTNDLGTSPNGDQFRVEASNDGGSSWASVESIGASASAWRPRQVHLSEMIAPTAQMRLRFVASDLGGASLVEALLDDLVVIGAPADDLDLDGVAGGLDNCPLQFNPEQEDGDGDAAGDACDCEPVDPGVSALPGSVGETLEFGLPHELHWETISQARAYNVYRGDPGAPPPGSGPACLAASLPGTSLTDGQVPQAGAAYYYLVTGRNCFGEGPAGANSQGEPRVLPASCP